MFYDLQVTEIQEAKITKGDPKHLLMALNYLKEYPLEKNFGGTFACNEKTAKKWAHFYIKKIEALRDWKIEWLFDEPQLRDQEKFIISVDGVHCRICEPRNDPSARWYSKKFNKAAFSYEIAIAIFRNQVCWINGPFPAGTPDISTKRFGANWRQTTG